MMKSKNQRRIVIALVSLAVLAVFSMLGATHKAKTRTAVAYAEAQMQTFDPDAVPSPNYTVRPGDTDGQPAPPNGEQPDCPGPGIGCDGVDGWVGSAPNAPHLFYLPPTDVPAGKLLIFLNGGAGRPNQEMPIYAFAASLGYRVIGLSYAGEAARINVCDDDPNPLSCYEDFMREVLFGRNCGHVACNDLNINDHSQDAAINRLVKALEWARANHPDDRWGEYLTANGDVHWTQVNIAGFSNGSSYASLMGTIYPNVTRVGLFSGPNDGDRNPQGEWVPASYIQLLPGVTNTHYVGLVHEKNKAAGDGTISTLYKVTDAWREFGMGEPSNRSAVRFDPATPNFGSAHMLISTNPTTDYIEAHDSVVRGRECSKYEDENGKKDCVEFNGDWIGYEPAWRCVLGVGNPELNTGPTANAGEDQTLECEGGGGATVTLDGSLSGDPECDVLSYTWTGPFGVVSGRKANVFLPVGTSVVTLVVSDGGPLSSADTISITVDDTQPPTISCPAGIVVEPTCSSGAVVNYATPAGSDGCTEVITTRTEGLASGSIFPIGTMTVTYSATDAASNAASCSFTVKVLTAAEVVQDLINRVQLLQPPLSGQQVQGLRSKLSEALTAINADKKNVACNKLNDLISQVQVYINNKKLTSVQGQPLINSAADVRNTLGCTALGCT